MNTIPEKAELAEGHLCDVSGLDRQGVLRVADAMHEQSALLQPQGDQAIESQVRHCIEHKCMSMPLARTRDKSLQDCTGCLKAGIGLPHA